MDAKYIARQLREIADYSLPGTSVAHNIKMLADQLDPPLQVIDLSPLVGSNVICEFWGGNGDKPPTGSLGFFGRIAPKACAGKDVYHSRHGVIGTSCRPLYNHPSVYMGGAWPVPEGFVVECFDGTWALVDRCVFIGSVYRITGVKPGWRLPFEGGE